MKLVIWKLKNGDRVGQETADQKLKEGLEYIERLKAEGEKVIEVNNKGIQLEILIEE